MSKRAKTKRAPRNWRELLVAIRRETREDDRAWAFWNRVCIEKEIPVDSDGDPWCRAEMLEAVFDFGRLRFVLRELRQGCLDELIASAPVR